MKDQEKNDVFGLLRKQWVAAGDGERHNEALLYGLVSYLLSREYQDQQAEHNSLTMIDAECGQMISKLVGDRGAHIQGTQLCSFCGRAEPEVKLIAGKSATICSICVGEFSTFFNQG